MPAATASAPGKVVLSGEYAVLDGAPAICMAINRLASASISARRGPTSTVRAPGYSTQVGEFEITDDGLQWLRGKSEFAVVDVAFAAGAIAAGSAIDIQLDTSAFVDSASGNKIGIGSSAAITVAVCAAGRQSLDIGALARRVHMKLQGDVGSGVDVACSLAGGLIEYRMAGASATRIRWPEGLKWRLVWTGVSADTRGKIARLESGVSKPSRVRLVVAAERLADAWRSSAADRVLAEYPAYIEQLREFSVDHKLGIFDAGHDELAYKAGDSDLIYKPCGAGGGDIGIVFGTDSDRLQQFVSELPAAKGQLDCEFTEHGVTLNTTAEQ